jgi:predicted ATPase
MTKISPSQVHIKQSDSAKTISLKGLNEEGVSKLIRSMYDGTVTSLNPILLSQITDKTHGNPQTAISLVQSLREKKLLTVVNGQLIGRVNWNEINLATAVDTEVLTKASSPFPLLTFSFPTPPIQRILSNKRLSAFASIA